MCCDTTEHLFIYCSVSFLPSSPGLLSLDSQPNLSILYSFFKSACTYVIYISSPLSRTVRHLCHCHPYPILSSSSVMHNFINYVPKQVFARFSLILYVALERLCTYSFLIFISNAIEPIRIECSIY